MAHVGNVYSNPVVRIRKRDFKNFCIGSMTAEDRLGGVRPSSGAAMLERDRAPMKSDASESLVLGAAEDGRTPITLPLLVTDPARIFEPIPSCPLF